MGITLGRQSYGEIKMIAGEGEITVGNFTSIAGGVEAFFAGDHNTKRISLFPWGHHGVNKIKRNHQSKGLMPDSVNKDLPIIIGNDCWIGYGSILFRGITVGDGAVIGAFSTITKNIPPYSVVVGHSRIVRKRFNDEDIDFLLKLKWWNFKDKTLSEMIHLLEDDDLEALKQWAKEYNRNE